MPIGLFLIKWDQIEGGMVYMKYPNEFDIPINIVQQIQISHDFVADSKITIQEGTWNSVSLYNEDKSIIVVLVLDKYDDAADYMIVLEEFNTILIEDYSEEELLIQLERIFDFSQTVFRTRDEVISKLSNEVAEMKMYEYDMQRRFEQIGKSEHLSVKSKLLFSLAIAHEELTIKDLRRSIKTSKRWLEEVLDTLVKNNVIGYSAEKEGYFLIF